MAKATIPVTLSREDRTLLKSLIRAVDDNAVTTRRNTEQVQANTISLTRLTRTLEEATASRREPQRLALAETERTVLLKMQETLALIQQNTTPTPVKVDHISYLDPSKITAGTLSADDVRAIQDQTVTDPKHVQIDTLRAGDKKDCGHYDTQTCACRTNVTADEQFKRERLGNWPPEERPLTARVRKFGHVHITDLPNGKHHIAGEWGIGYLVDGYDTRVDQNSKVTHITGWLGTLKDRKDVCHYPIYQDEDN